MRISIIVASADNGVIGNGGTLPWRLRSDLKRFRALTMGKPVVMGRKTFQSLRKPLDGRDNIVVTGNASFHADGAQAAPDLSAGLALAEAHAVRRGADEVMVIGGGEIYAQALPRASRVYLTRVHATVPGDTIFPALSHTEWRLAAREALPRGPEDDYDATLEIYERIGP
jgi:dihydrofolate reductase